MKRRMSPEEIAQHWRLLRTRRCQKARERLIEHYVHLVHITAGRMYCGLPGWFEKVDLVGSGMIGLIKAADQFNPARGIKFETYAIALIRGEILEALRGEDWVPRSVREYQKQIAAARLKFEMLHGHEPTVTELATYLEMEEERLLELLQKIEQGQVLSISDLLCDQVGERLSLADVLAGDEEAPWFTAYQNGQRGLLRKAIASLPEREQLVIERYYDADQTFKAISLEMEISESRVYQLHGQAIGRLRDRLKGVWE